MMHEQSARPLPPPTTPNPIWARGILWLGALAMITAAGLYVFRSCRALPGEVIDKTGLTIGRASRALEDVAAAFNRGTITTSFVSYATSLDANRRLQFATLRQTELFTRTDEASTAFGYLALPDVIVEARTPVEYTYYLNLDAPWQLRITEADRTVLVLAPDIAFNQPAIDASEITYEVRKGSFFRDTAQARENLKKSITGLLRQRARDHIALVRETGRQQTAEFVEGWLGREYADGQQYRVKVRFRDEETPAGARSSKPQLEKPASPR